LNVVVYRVPAGMSLVQPGSHCPACKRPIRWHDNVPVLSWIMLGGRCRDCRAAISLRYPVVEAVSAALFLALGLAEGVSLGSPEAAAIAAYRLVLLCTLLAAGLIEGDQARLPWRLALPAAAVGAIAPLFRDQLRGMPALVAGGGLPAGLVDGAAGLACGAAIGLAWWRLAGPATQRGLLIAPALTGLFLGWQAVAVLAVPVVAVRAAARALTTRRRWPDRVGPGLWWLAADLAWILAREPLALCWPLLP
jgi:leader peptidase (prepilin peptidase)/N-methyltransferase